MDACFGANGRPLAATSKVLAEFVKQAKLEKGAAGASVMPAYMPNLFNGSSPAAGAAGWVDMQCALLGVDTLDHVLAGLASHCSPRHPTRFEPSFLDLSGIL